MRRVIAASAIVVIAMTALAQSGADALRSKALAALESTAATERAEAAAWVAMNGQPADDRVLLPRLFDDDGTVREIAEQGLWVLWSRSGDQQIDALLARGIEEMHSGRLDDAIATFSGIVRDKPRFAEGWNKRATALFLAGELRKSLADCDEVLKRNPSHFGALAGYGQIYFQMEAYDKAILYWRRALAVNPNMRTLAANIRDAEERLAASKRQRT